MYAGVARTHILSSSIGRLTLERVRASHVEGWVVELRRKGLAESTVRSAYTILRAVLDTAVRNGALASNPAAVVRRPRVTAKEAAHLTPAEVAELLRAAQDTRYARCSRCWCTPACATVRRWLCSGRTSTWTRACCGCADRSPASRGACW